MNQENPFSLSDDEKKHALNDDQFEWTNDFLFDEKNFNTILIDQQKQNAPPEQNTPQKKYILDIEKFTLQYQNPAQKNDLLLWLKQNNYKNLLTEQIQQCTNEKTLAQLICAYWEAGFNDSNDLLIFIPHLLSANYSIVLEANSAIIGLSKPFPANDAQTALQLIQKNYNTLPAETLTFVDEILNLLKSQLSESE